MSSGPRSAGSPVGARRAAPASEVPAGPTGSPAPSCSGCIVVPPSTSPRVPAATSPPTTLPESASPPGPTASLDPATPAGPSTPADPPMPTGPPTPGRRTSGLSAAALSVPGLAGADGPATGAGAVGCASNASRGSWGTAGSSSPGDSASTGRSALSRPESVSVSLAGSALAENHPTADPGSPAAVGAALIGPSPPAGIPDIGPRSRGSPAGPVGRSAAPGSSAPGWARTCC